MVFALRAHLIGHWIGGYPGGLSGVLGTSSVIDLVVSSVRAVLGSLGWLLVGLGGALLMALVARARDNSAERDRPLAVVLVGLAGLALCLAPVVTNLIPGEVAAEHQRTLYFADLFGCLGVGALVLAAARLGHGASLGAGLVLLALVGQRGHAAWVDTHDWARAGDEAEHLVGQARLLVGSLPPSDLPVLVTAPPPAVDGCYLLKFGVPDRFRAPFPVTPRPIWPWGEIFPTPGQQREAAVEVVNHVRLPLDTGPTLAPVLPLSVRASGHAGPAVVVGDGGAVTAELSLTPALVDGLVAGTEDHRSLEYPYLELPAATATGHLEALVISEQGYGTGLRPGAVDGPIPLGELLALPLGDGSGGQRLLDVISWTADLRATEAWLELRLVSDEGELLAASRWLHLVWDRDLRDHLLPWDSF